MLKYRGRIIASPPENRYRVLTESKVVSDSQFPLQLEMGATIDALIENVRFILKRV